MHPSESSLSPRALTGILDALEHDPPHTRRRLGDLASLSPSTVSRAVGHLTEAGVLTYPRYGQADPKRIDGAEALILSPLALLPILIMSHNVGSVYVLQGDATPVGATVTELNPLWDTATRLTSLCRRAMILLNGCATATGLPVAAPTLWMKGGVTDSNACTETILDILGVAPLAILGEETAIARGIKRVLPSSFQVDSLLYLRTELSAVSYLYHATE